MKIFYAFLCFAAVFCSGAERFCNVVFFESKKFVSFFDEAIIGKCLLVSDDSGRIRWQTLSPYKSIMIFDGSEAVAFESDGAKWRRINLPSSKGLLQIMAGLKDAISSGKKIPTKIFNVTKSQDGDLILAPKDESFARIIKSITVKAAGNPPAPQLITITDPMDDRTELKVLENFPTKDAQSPFDTANPQSFDADKYDSAK